MPSILVRSGAAGTPGVTVVMTTEAENFEYQFPRDLRTAFAAFTAWLGIGTVHTFMLPVPSSANFCIIEYVGGGMTTDDSERLATVNIYLERALTNTAEVTNPNVSSTWPISYVVMRVKRFLEDNNNWEGKIAIDRLVSIDDISGSAAPQLFNEEPDPHVQTALLTVTYAVRNTAFQSSD